MSNLYENDATVRFARSTQLTSPAVSLFEHLAGVAATRGEHPAVVQVHRSMSYRQLVDAATGFCNRLALGGARSGDAIAVMLENRIEFVVAAFGIWKLGAVLVPLNDRLQEQELLRYLKEGQVGAVVTSKRMQPVVQSLRDRGAPLRQAWLCDSEGEWSHDGVECDAETDASNVAVTPTTPAVTQYSTGSTGTPKKVTRSHANLLGEFAAVAHVLHTSRDDRVVGVAPFFHSHGLMNSAMQALLSGATLFPVESFFPKDVAGLIESARITVVPAVPFMFQLLADLKDPRDLSSIRVAISAGAPLAVETARAFMATYGVVIRPLYGSTETGVITIADGQGVIEESGYVGTPIPGVQVSSLTEAGAPLPANREGRIYISSEHAADRYDNTAGNTESYFDATGFFPGDLGKVSQQGVVLSGRHRGFINVGGNKVDPSEVEQVLLELPQVTEAVVFGLPDGAAGEKVKAVLVATGGAPEVDVRAHCARRLADFKRPRIIEMRAELPKSPLGKVLRKYLVDESLGTPTALAFDPRSGFRPTAGLPGMGQNPELSTVPPFLRVLLVTDGTVTKSLEAYFWEPVEVEVLSHVEAQSLVDRTAIGVSAGDDILRRRVLLRGKISRAPYAFAESIIASEVFGGELRRRLIDEQKGIGELLREGRGETHRELLQVRKSEAGEIAEYLGVERQSPVLVRSYRIFYCGRAAIEIEETFPVQRFASAAG